MLGNHKIFNFLKRIYARINTEGTALITGAFCGENQMEHARKRGKVVSNKLQSTQYTSTCSIGREKEKKKKKKYRVGDQSEMSLTAVKLTFSLEQESWGVTEYISRSQVFAG